MIAIALIAYAVTDVVAVKPPKDAVMVTEPAVDSVLPFAGLKVQSAVTSLVICPAVAVTAMPVRSKESPTI